MFRKRPSKGYMKQEFAAQSSRRPSRVIHLPYYESPEADDQASIDEQASILSQSVYEDQTVAQEPLFHEPFIWELPRHEPEVDLEEEEYEDYEYQAEESEQEEEYEEEEDEDDEETEEFSPQIYKATATVLPPKSIFNSSWDFPSIKDDDMFEHYLSNDDNISIYSIHEPAVATAVPIFTKPRLIDIPPMAGRKRRAQYDTMRQHSRNQSNSSDNSSQYSSNESSSHSDNESNGSWDSPASSLATTPTTTTPVSSSGFPKRSRTNPYTRPMSGTFPQLDKLADKYAPDDAPSNKPFRRSVARSGAPSRASSMVIPACIGDDIDEMLEKADKAMRRREWQSSSSVWHR